MQIHLVLVTFLVARTKFGSQFERFHCIVRWFQGRVMWQMRNSSWHRDRKQRDQGWRRGTDPSHHGDPPPATRLHLPASRLAVNSSGNYSSGEHHSSMRSLSQAPPVSTQGFVGHVAMNHSTAILNIQPHLLSNCLAELFEATEL